MLSLWLACAASDAYLRPATALQSIVVVISSSGVPKSGFSSTSAGSSMPASARISRKPLQPRARHGGVVQLGRDAALGDGRVRDPVGLNVVGVPVEAVLVVGDDDLRLVACASARPAGRAASSTGVRQKESGRVVLRPALHARVVVAEELEVVDTPRTSQLASSSWRRSGTTTASSCPGSPGFTPPGASPSSPLVQVTSTVRTPSAP